MTTSKHLEKSKKDRMWSWSFPSQKECKVRPQLKYFDGRLLDDEELRIVHQARLPHFPSTFNWRFRGLLIVPQCSLSTIAGHSECRSAKNQNVETYRQQTGEDPVLSVLWMHLRWRIKKPFTFFLVWWFKLILFPGIHEKGEVVSIENNSRENQSTPAVHWKDVSYGEGI